MSVVVLFFGYVLFFFDLFCVMFGLVMCYDLIIVVDVGGMFVCFGFVEV